MKDSTTNNPYLYSQFTFKYSIDMFKFLIYVSDLIFYGNMNNDNCRVTICNPNPEELGYKPNELNTINLQRVSKRTGLLVN